MIGKQRSGAKWSVRQGDALTLLAEMPAASVDVVVTDPPYASTGQASAFVSKSGGVPVEYQFYEAWIREHITAWRRVLKPTGAIWMTLDWRGAVCVETACGKMGLSSPKVGVWDREATGMGHILRGSYEVFAVVPMPEFSRRSTTERDVWRHKWTPGNRKHGHSAEKPVDLCRRAVRLLAATGAVVLDPFCGSGSIGVAALREGCSFIGLERDADFAATAAARLGAEASRPMESSVPEPACA